MNLERRQNSGSGMTHAFSCLRCSAPIKPGRKFCSQCGTPVAATPGGAMQSGLQAGFVGRISVCPECGFENHRSDLFCKACGELLAAAPSGRLRLDAAEVQVVRLSAEKQESGVNVEAPSARDLEPAQPLIELGAAPAAAANPAAEPLPAPAHPPVKPTAPAFLQERSLQEGRSSRLSPRTLGVASVGLLLIGGILLLHSRHATGRGAQPVSMSPEAVAATTSSSSTPVVAVNASVSAEKAPGLSGVTGKAVTFVRAKKTSGSSQEAPRGNANAAIAEVAAADGSSASSQTTTLPAAGSSVPAPPPNVASNAVGSASFPETQPEPPASAALAAPPPGGPVAPRPSNAPAAAERAARPDAPPLRVGGDVQAGKILSRPAPIYPAVARAAGIQGLVQLEAVIAKDGSVRDLKVISGNRILAEAALYAVRHWRYQPTELDGVPVEVRTGINVDFKLP